MTTNLWISILKRLFVFELKHQCNVAITAYNEMIRSISGQNGDNVWSTLESFLTAAAKIAKIFWPFKSKPEYEKRGQELRTLFKVEETVAFRNRCPRNYLEHFDERLEDWVIQTKDHNVVDRGILPNASFFTGNVDYLRVFFSRNRVFTCGNDEYELDPIYDSIVKLSENVDKEYYEITGLSHL